MKIIVLVKQVPDTTEIKIDKVTGTLIRDGVKSVINPDDLAGVEEALKLKSLYDAHVSVVTMGPMQAKNMLQELIALGVDECFLLSDPKFAGSDTWSTSIVLSSFLKTLDYDLIISGRQAIDGDTAQVGPQVAERLNIPAISYISKIEKIENRIINLQKSIEDRIEFCNVNMPCLISTLSSMNTPRYMHIEKIWDSFSHEIKVFNHLDFEVDLNEVGAKGSPTKVKTTFTKEVGKKSDPLVLGSNEASLTILNFLKEKGCL